MRKILNLYDATARGEATDRVCSLPDLKLYCHLYEHLRGRSFPWNKLL